MSGDRQTDGPVSPGLCLLSHLDCRPLRSTGPRRLNDHFYEKTLFLLVQIILCKKYNLKLISDIRVNVLSSDDVSHKIPTVANQTSPYKKRLFVVDLILSYQVV